MGNAKNHCFSIGSCRFYACLGNVGLRAILGPTCSQLELTWGHLGPTLDRLGPNFVHLGASLGTNGPILVPTWHLMKPPWRQLGHHMGRSGSDLEWPWTDPDPYLDRMGPDWVGLDPHGSVLDRLGSDFDRLGSDLDRILARSWAILDAN